MKLPSLGSIGSKALITAAKYPLPLIMCALSAICSILIFEAKPDNMTVLTRIILTSALAAATFLSIQSLSIVGKIKTVMLIIAAAFLIYYGLTFDMNDVDAYAYALHSLAAIAAILVAPFIFRKNENTEFWEWGKSLILRALMAFLYSHVLYGGIALALFSIETLFGVKWYGWFHIGIYSDLYIIMSHFVGPWIFLAGIPGTPHEENAKPFPRSIRAFALYVLLPIAGIYSIILYSYAIRILIKWELPNGWVSLLILAFAGVGLATLLLLYPLLKRGELGKRFARLPGVFFAILMPLLVLLYWAISKRISEYGITEDRYFVVVSMIWLAVISLYFLIKGFEKIKIIPISVIIILILTSFGPWGAFSVSETSQTNRLINILKKTGALKNGKLIKGVKLKREDIKEINGLNRYLGFTHDSKKLQAELGITFKYQRGGNELAQKLGFSDQDEYNDEHYFNASIDSMINVDLEGADKLILLEVGELSSQLFEMNTIVEGKNFRISIEENNGHKFLNISVPNGKSAFDLSEIADKLSNKGEDKSDIQKSLENMTFVAAATNFRCKLILDRMEFKYSPKIKIESIKGVLLVYSLNK